MRRKILMWLSLSVVGLFAALVVVMHFRSCSIEDVVQLRQRTETNVDFVVHLEGHTAVSIHKGDNLCDTIYKLFADVRLTRRLLPKRVVVDGGRLVMYVAAWNDEQDVARLPTIEIAFEPNGRYFVNIGESGFVVVSGTQLLDDFVRLISAHE